MDGSRRGARPKIGGKFLPPITAVIASLGPQELRIQRRTINLQRNAWLISTS